MKRYDLAVVGAGIVGIACALAAKRKGLEVAIVERDAHAVGASVRNFGFITVSGQRRGEHWMRARRTRDVWAEIAPLAGIDIVHRGTTVLARRPEAVAVAEAFLRTEMGEGCRLLSAREASDIAPHLTAGAGSAVLWSPHELRVESRTAIPKLASFLERAHGVTFHWSTAALDVAPPQIHTSRGTLFADAAIVCPGNDLSTLFPDHIAKANLSICTLQMLRVAPATPVRLGAAVMSDLSLARYDGFAALPEASVLARRLDEEHGEARTAGIHLIVVQSADGSLVVGDSHVYGAAPDPFTRERFDELIMAEFDRVLNVPFRIVAERWTGSYPSSASEVVFVGTPQERVRIASVTGGTGASTAFAFGEEVVKSMFG